MMTRATWKYIFVLVLIWLVILGIMRWQILSVVDDSNQKVADLSQKEKQLELLQNQYERLDKKYEGLNKKLVEIQSLENQLKIEAENFRKKNLELQQKLNLISEKQKVFNGLTPHSKEFLATRRRAEKILKELWYFVSSEVSKVNTIAGQNVRSKLQKMMETLEDMHNVLSVNFENLGTIDGQKEWAKKEHKSLGDLVQRRLHFLQHPKDCKAAKKLVCQLNGGCGSGFSCQVHHLMYCFVVAYGLERTLIVDTSSWNSKWNSILKPFSENCSTYEGNLVSWSRQSFKYYEPKNVLIPLEASLFPRPKYLPLAVPKDLAGRIEQIHGYPFVWWIGQFAKYLFRYQPEVQDKMAKKRSLLGFKKPIVGVHVRRTDKIETEAAFHSIEEYMYWVDLYYNKLESVQTVEQRRVYLATDDSKLLSEAKEKYKNYEFISDNEISKSAALINSRTSDASLRGIVFDIQMLSECDYIVCTFSSNVCRLVYALMQSLQPDASKNVQSLDDIYWIHGQSEHDVQAVYPHKAQDSSQIDLNVGDRIGIAGNHWDGYFTGVNRNTGRTGLFPSYKVQDVMVVKDFPTYEGV